MIPLRSFSVLRGKNFLTENCDTPSLTPLLIQKIHRNLKFCEEQKGSSAKGFVTVKQNSFDGNSWYPGTLKTLTFLDTGNFLKLGRVSLRTLSVVWDNTLSTTNRDPPPLSTKCFHTGKFLKHRKVPPPEVSRVFRQKIVDGKFWYSPLFIQKLFRYCTFSETQHRRIPIRKLSALWDKNFSAENLDTPPFIHKPIS